MRIIVALGVILTIILGIVPLVSFFRIYSNQGELGLLEEKQTTVGNENSRSVVKANLNPLKTEENVELSEEDEALLSAYEESVKKYEAEQEAIFDKRLAELNAELSQYFMDKEAIEQVENSENNEEKKL